MLYAYHKFILRPRFEEITIIAYTEGLQGYLLTKSNGLHSLKTMKILA
jgi:hypothetical protein